MEILFQNSYIERVAIFSLLESRRSWEKATVEPRHSVWISFVRSTDVRGGAAGAANAGAERQRA